MRDWNQNMGSTNTMPTQAIKQVSQPNATLATAEKEPGSRIVIAVTVLPRMSATGISASNALLPRCQFPPAAYVSISWMPPARLPSTLPACPALWLARARAIETCRPGVASLTRFRKNAFWTCEPSISTPWEPPATSGSGASA
ncbi:MAG: hypothetical protein BWX70_02986 [Verrucomicrobia bacterium ADurb.Bin070]|nr:MAG: hypothetical protein BWX70_02986 [Verrucomicrobia bacterium ADurb.Bin070]